MSIEVTCPGCGATLKLPEKFARRGLVCTKCRHEFRLPAVESATTVEPVPPIPRAAPASTAPPSSASARPPKPPVVSQPVPIAKRESPRPQTPPVSARPRNVAAVAPRPNQKAPVARAKQPAGDDAWDFKEAFDGELEALPPRIEPAKKSKRRSSNRRGSNSDWIYYAIGFIGFGPLLLIIQPLLIWNAFAGFSAAVQKAHLAAAAQRENANNAFGNVPPRGFAGREADAADDSATRLPLDSFVSRDAQRILWIVVPLWNLAMIVYLCAGGWATFAKAGRPGWAVLIPIYNVVTLFGIAEVSLWWLLLIFIPGVNLLLTVFVAVKVAEKFGKDVGFGIGLALLGPIFYPVLGFGSARYKPARTRFASDSF